MELNLVLSVNCRAVYIYIYILYYDKKNLYINYIMIKKTIFIDVYGLFVKISISITIADLLRNVKALRIIFLRKGTDRKVSFVL